MYIDNQDLGMVNLTSFPYSFCSINNYYLAPLSLKMSYESQSSVMLTWFYGSLHNSNLKFLSSDPYDVNGSKSFCTTMQHLENNTVDLLTREPQSLIFVEFLSSGVLR